MKQIYILIGFLGIGLNLCFGQVNKVNLTIRECPPFKFYDINNEELSLNNLKGKAIVINIILIQSPEIIYDFIKISNECDKKNVVFIAIGDMQYNIESCKNLFNKSNYHLVILDDKEYKKFLLSLNKFPAIIPNFIIDESGNIVYSKFSYFTDEEFADYKRRILNLL